MSKPEVLIKAVTPTAPEDPNLWRVRYDRVDPGGKVSLRYANRMLHLGIGRPHTGTDVIIDPERTYQPATKNG